MSVLARRDPDDGFDFLFGTWRVHNQRLKERLAGSSEWSEFETNARCRPIWGGSAANIDEIVGETPFGALRGMTLRLYDPEHDQWRIYWATEGTGKLDEPMTGRFVDGVGEFYNVEMFEGRSILVRFIWSDVTPVSCRWEQAFSDDGGRSWETNWIMQFSRDHAEGGEGSRGEDA